MIHALSMVLIIDEDHFSNSTLSLAIRKLGLSRNVVCTTSSSKGLAYLHKQKTNNYPFPELIFYNPSTRGVLPNEFMDSYRNHFESEFDTKLVLLEDKTERVSMKYEPNVTAVIKKPVSMGKLLRVFNGQAIHELIG